MTGDEVRARFEALLAELAARTGLKDLAAEPDGVCLLVFDGGTRLYLVADPGEAQDDQESHRQVEQDGEDQAAPHGL